MTQEQLIQEARIEAEKVYPTESYVNDARREGFIQCYIQQAEKRKSEALKFGKFLGTKCFRGLDGEKEYWGYLPANDNTQYSTKEIYEIFIQQQLKQG